MKKTIHIAFLLLLLCAGCSLPSAQTPAEEADKMAKKLIDSALIYIDRQDYTPAMLQLKEAEKLLPRLNNTKTCYQICQYIGWINENNGADELALHYQRMALHYAEEYGKPEYVVDVLINQANTFFHLNMPDSAWQANNKAALFYQQADRSQQSFILKNMAYHYMLTDSLAQAEQHAYRAVMLAQDSSAIGNAMSLLCQIYLRQNRDEHAQMLMGLMPRNGGATIEYNRLLIRSSIEERNGNYRQALADTKRLNAIDDSLNAEKKHLDIVKIQNQYDREVMQREKAEQNFAYSLIIIGLLLVIFALSYWYFRRTQQLYKRYHDRISAVKDEMTAQLTARNSTIEELKQAADSKLLEIEKLKKGLPTQLATGADYESITQTKMGIDVLHAILHNENISQFGKKEQTAVTQVMRIIDAPLAQIIAEPAYALTPKETFFCIMEHNGQDDRRKARSFCCSEQAIRSTKSRLGKKLDLSLL